ncbi:hypothetical protein M8J76_014701 [Diaphorina citri]|nr:hypothetical protein M8J76_014701 [Diaphorina citri]
MNTLFQLTLLLILNGVNLKLVENPNSNQESHHETDKAHQEVLPSGDNVDMKRYRPVLVIHGILSGNKTLEKFKERIERFHPGTKVVIPDNYSNWASLEPMWNQVLFFGSLVMKMSQNHPEGIHLIGYSQGGLIARGILEQFPNHNVRNFISLSSPHGGQYGTKFLHTLFPELVRETAYELFYSTVGQHISVGNYWNDPHHQKLFFKYSKFLPFINNLNATPNSNLFKLGLLRLHRMVLIGGPNDSVITPWQSSQFGHFTEDESVVELRDTKMYTENTLGLRTLDKQGKLVLISVPGVDHFQWHNNPTVIDQHVLPYLD